MVKKEECFRSRGKIIAFEKVNNNEIIYALQHKIIKSFSTLTCKTLGNLSLEYLSTQTTAICFHKSLDLVAIANGKTIYIINTKSKMVLQTIISYTGDITTLHFVQNSPYLITGTTNGRVVQYRYDGKSSLSRLCSFPFNNPIGKRVIGKNYVGAIDSNEKYVACSGYGGAITIIKLHSLTHKQTIQSARVRVNTLKLISDELLISASIDANIYFHDLNKYKSTKTISSPIGNISDIIPIQNSSYAILVGESNKLALLDTQEQKVVLDDFVKFEENIKFVALLDDNSIIAVLENNSVEKVYLSTVEELTRLIEKNLLGDAFLLLEKNPLLQNTPEHRELEELYSKLYNKALDAFLNANKQEAVKLLEQFLKVKSKKKELDIIIDSFDQYKKFYTLILEKKYHVAYAISDKYPALKQTHPYQKMEDEFKRAFAFAQKQIKIGRDDVAKDALAIYSGTNSKKTIVKLLLNQNKDFLIFLKSLQAKNYKNIAILIKKDETFTQLPHYQELLKEIEKNLQEIKEDIFQSQIDEAIEKIKQLQYLPHITEQLKDLYELANYTKMFLHGYHNNDFLSCYATIDKSKLLDQLELSDMLEKHWHKLMDKCENLALKGDLKGIKEALAELISLKSRSAKIGDVLRLSFHTKIKQLLAKRTYIKAEAIIYSYIDIFGLDTEIKALMKTCEKLSGDKLAITENQELFKSRNAWLESEFIVGDYKGQF
ncbi:hypothetical protein [Sulfurimonas sp.]|uniref:hypothetical protein n=1 Tax=Sulfurimonas sp. TaxID=2022749 RepID=UPI003D1027AA